MGRVILVTGSSRGIGAAVAEHLAQKGDSVIINYIRNREKAAEVVHKLKAGGMESEYMQCDVSDKSAVQRMIGDIISRYGRIDVLVNNAGILFQNYLLQAKETDYAQLMNTNLMGAVYCSEEVLPHMKKTGYGRIINISSVSVLCPLVGSALYALSKAMLNQYTLHTAYRFRDCNITVNAVISGFVETDMAAEYRAYERLMTTASYPCIYGTADSVAEGVALFANDAHGFITGQLLTVDGGYSLQTE